MFQFSNRTLQSFKIAQEFSPEIQQLKNTNVDTAINTKANDAKNKNNTTVEKYKC